MKELNQLPDGLNEMPSIKKVTNWYAQSFEVRRIFTAVSNTKGGVAELTQNPTDVRNLQLYLDPSYLKN